MRRDGMRASLRRRSVAGFAVLGIGCMGAPARAPLPRPVAAEGTLVFDGATVVDVEHGKLIASQRVVVVGNRIRAVGSVKKVALPAGARVVNARGKYLLPGFWDMHAHTEIGLPLPEAEDSFHRWVYARFIANGVTGIREMAQRWPERYGSREAADSFRAWQREIMAGTLIGPRAVGPSADLDSRIKTTDQARRVIDSVKAAGDAFFKWHGNNPDRNIFFALMREARRVGLPVVGHVSNTVTSIEAADSGMRSIEHTSNHRQCWNWIHAPLPDSATFDAACTPVIQAYLRNDTWVTPTLTLEWSYVDYNYQYGTAPPDSVLPPDSSVNPYPILEKGLWVNDLRFWRIMHRMGMRNVLAGTDWAPSPAADSAGAGKFRPGLSLRDELVFLVDAGLTPLEALQAATLNPARFFHATDSLGTVAVGKLADLVLLDADPLADIANVLKLWGVVANGRYFDRVMLTELAPEGADPDSGLAAWVRRSRRVSGETRGRATEAGETVTAFVDVSVIPMDRERVLPGQTVVVRGDRIIALGPSTTIKIPDDAVRVEGRGKFLMPGLGDMHVHLADIGSDDGNALDTTLVDDMLLSFVANGVTTVRDMHSGPSRSGDQWMPALRRRITSNEVLGPRIYAAGDTHDTSAAAMARQVEALKAAGYDFVKVVPTRDTTKYDSIVAAAHRVGLPIVGHGFMGFIDSPNYGMARAFADRWRSTEHLFGYFWYATGTVILYGEEEAMYPPVADTTIRRIALEVKRAGVWNCPTLAIEELSETNYRDANFDLRFVKALHDVGAGLLMGTDAYARLGNDRPNFVRSGFLVHRELELLVEVGLTPFQALQTATTNVAQFLHTEDSTGTVAVGKRADLVLLKANPLVNIRNTTALAGVMVAGRWLPRSVLEARIDSLPSGGVDGEGEWGMPKVQMRMLRNVIWH